MKCCNAAFLLAIITILLICSENELYYKSLFFSKLYYFYSINDSFDQVFDAEVLDSIKPVHNIDVSVV